MSRGFMNVGDTGMVNKDDAAMNWIRRAEIIKVPAGEGDVWGFRNLDTGAEVFTNERFTFYRDKEPQGCPVCQGDCSGANPPVAFCPMRQQENSR